MKIWESILKCLSCRSDARRVDPVTVSRSAIQMGSSSEWIEASDISKVEASLRDDFTVDTVVLTITPREGCPKSISEDHPHFQLVVEWLKENGLVSNPSWLEQVTRPPMVEKTVEIYRS